VVAAVAARPDHRSMADQRLRTDESGQTMAEYAVVLGVIVIAIMTTFGLLSTAIQTLIGNVISSI
jgi:Flp pilus assembly pilin Flp